MSLHERLRDCEAAPWVIEEIKNIEEELDQLRAAMKAIADGQTYCSYTHNKAGLKCRIFAQKALEPQSKFKAENHITGKVYDLTQENMTTLIRTVEKLVNENARLRDSLGMLTDRS